MASKLFTRFRSENIKVIAGTQEMAEEVGIALGERFDLFRAEGEILPDWVVVQKLIGRMLAGRGERLGEIDHRLEVDRTSDRRLREERDRQAEELRRQLRSARFLLDESFGRGLASGLFRRRDLSRATAIELVALAREIAASLRSPGLALPQLAGDGSLPDPTTLAAALDERSGEVESLLETLAPKAKRETFTIGQKDKEWQEAQDARLRAQDLLFGLYRAAGYDHLAARLRPKRRRKAAEEEGGQNGPAPAAIAGMAVRDADFGV